ncbi:hypothetical protein LCGC14_2319970 [marine sediment metagenome]|uniref:Uncharacterized protein n=1 Tax=marine sediment metagenome TaxID=412755 RepID=A0A0F9FCX0_9ZZZZ
MVTERRTHINFPRGRKLTLVDEPLDPEFHTVRWGKEGLVGSIDENEGIITIDPSLPGDVASAVQLFMAKELGFDIEELAGFQVQFKRVR